MIKESNSSFFQMLKVDSSGLDDSTVINHAIKTWKNQVSRERLEEVSKIFDKWVGLIWTEYKLWWLLWENGKTWIDCSHFVAYCLWMQDWQRENTWSLDSKYNGNEVKMSRMQPWDLLMRPWHYDPDVKREIGHVEIVIWKTKDNKIITLGASWLSRKWDKYTVDGKKLSKHNCVWFSVREQEPWMKILRA